MRWLLLVLLMAARGHAAARPVVWCFGDSITANYAPLLAATHPEWDVRNLGVAGERSDAAAIRLQTLLDTEAAPDVVVLETGTNDMLDYTVLANPVNHSPDETAARIGAMRDLLQGRGIAVIVATPVGTLHPLLKYGLARGGYKVYGGALSQLRALVWRMPPEVSLRLTSDRLYANFVHPNWEGYAILVRRVGLALWRAGF